MFRTLLLKHSAIQFFGWVYLQPNECMQKTFLQERAGVSTGLLSYVNWVVVVAQFIELTLLIFHSSNPVI